MRTNVCVCVCVCLNACKPPHKPTLLSLCLPSLFIARLYPVDYARVNEYGYAYESEVDRGASQDKGENKAADTQVEREGEEKKTK